MAKLYFRHGAMGSSKTANALMVEYNYYERGKKALLLKPKLDNRDGEKVIRSRMGLQKECMFVEDLVQMSDDEIRRYDCVIVDEAQFCKKSDIELFVHIVDDLSIPVICYGLRTDFRREPFEGSTWLLAWADVIEEIKTVCWCGQGAQCNTRINPQGKVIKHGEQIVLGANDNYVALCRKHYKEEKTGPNA
ncbi:MAG: thymidine kinase [Lachnospiraceae bacterium]|nr:thymidine kinase [Lachnospiraceae bacterium]